MLEISNPWVCKSGHRYGDPRKPDEESGIVIAVDSAARERHFPPHMPSHPRDKELQS